MQVKLYEDEIVLKANNFDDAGKLNRDYHRKIKTLK